MRMKEYIIAPSKAEVFNVLREAVLVSLFVWILGAEMLLFLLVSA